MIIGDSGTLWCCSRLSEAFYPLVRNNVSADWKPCFRSADRFCLINLAMCGKMLIFA